MFSILFLFPLYLHFRQDTEFSTCNCDIYSKECEDYCTFNKPAFINLIKKKIKNNPFLHFQDKTYNICTLKDWYSSISNPSLVKLEDKPLYRYLSVNLEIFRQCSALPSKEEVNPLTLYEKSTSGEPTIDIKVITKTNTVHTTVIEGKPNTRGISKKEDPSFKELLEEIKKLKNITSTVLKTSTIVKKEVKTTTHNVIIYDDSPPSTTTLYRTVAYKPDLGGEEASLPLKSTVYIVKTLSSTLTVKKKREKTRTRTKTVVETSTVHKKNRKAVTKTLTNKESKEQSTSILSSQSVLFSQSALSSQSILSSQSTSLDLSQSLSLIFSQPTSDLASHSSESETITLVIGEPITKPESLTEVGPISSTVNIPEKADLSEKNKNLTPGIKLKNDKANKPRAIDDEKNPTLKSTTDNEDIRHKLTGNKENPMTKNKEQTKIDDQELPKIDDKPKIENKEKPKIEDKEHLNIENKETSKIDDKETSKIDDKEKNTTENKEKPKIENKELPKIDNKEKPKIENKELPKIDNEAITKIDDKELPMTENKEKPKIENKEKPKIDDKNASIIDLEESKETSPNDIEKTLKSDNRKNDITDKELPLKANNSTISLDKPLEEPKDKVGIDNRKQLEIIVEHISKDRKVKKSGPIKKREIDSPKEKSQINPLPIKRIKRKCKDISKEINQVNEYENKPLSIGNDHPKEEERKTKKPANEESSVSYREDDLNKSEDSNLDNKSEVEPTVSLLNTATSPETLSITSTSINSSLSLSSFIDSPSTTSISSESLATISPESLSTTSISPEALSTTSISPEALSTTSISPESLSAISLKSLSTVSPSKCLKDCDLILDIEIEKPCKKVKTKFVTSTYKTLTTVTSTIKLHRFPPSTVTVNTPLPTYKAVTTSMLFLNS